jgi:hypothetical protein
MLEKLKLMFELPNNFKPRTGYGSKNDPKHMWMTKET